MHRGKVMNEATLSIIRVWRVHKSLMVDLSAGVILALVELGLLAFLMYLGLLDPVLSRHPLGDSPNYEAMARNPFSSDPEAHIPAHCWRVLTPWLVYVLTRLGLPLHSGFLLITVIGLCGTVIGIYALLRLCCDATPWQALAVALLVQTLYAIGLFVLWGYVGTDALEYLLLVLAFILYWQDQPRWLMVVLALAVLDRETALIAVAAFAGEQVIRRDWQRLKTYLPAYIVPILIILVLHIAIYQVGSWGLLDQIDYTWRERFGLVGRPTTLELFGTVNVYALNVYHLTIGSFDLLLPLLLLQVIHPPYVARRPVVWIFLLATAAQIPIAWDNERLMIVAAPVFAVAALYELRWIAQRTKLPAAAIGFSLVLVQSLFLLGQYYKFVGDFSLIAKGLQEMHWVFVPWLGVLLILIATTVGAALWVLGVGIPLFYRKVRV
jgi:hypothetical protein